jgi:type VI protein secretion system component VasF
LGRHSAEIQRGRAKPVFKRDRLPTWVPRVAGALLLLVALGGLGSSILAEQPAAPSFSAQLHDDVTALTDGPAAERLAEAKAEADAARARAVKPLLRQRAARTALRKATRELRHAGNRLVSAEADQRRFAHRLAVLTAREEREAVRAAERAEREAVEIEEEESLSSECDPNYTGCVPVYPPDVDCAEVGETVTVTGSDPHGLDADGDLVGCE